MRKPTIRFEGYTDDWEQRKVGELLEERNEQAPMSADYPLMAFIANHGVAPKGERYDRSALVNDETGKKYKRTEFGDFIYSSNNLETGSIGLNKYGNACISPVYSIFKSTGKAELDFLGRRFLKKDFINEMVKWRQGVVYGQWKIHETDFMKIQVTIPNMEEQKEIGQYFDHLDHLITLHQRKCEETKKLKKFMLQKIFPQKGEKVPEIRFSGFTADWEQRKLGDVIEKLTGGASIAPDDYVDVGYRTIPKGAVNSSGVADMSGCKIVSENFFKKNISSKISSGELVTSLRDLVPTAPNMGRIVRICGETEDFLMPQGVYSIIVKERISEDFLITYSNSPEYRKIIMAEKNGSTQVHIRNGEFLNIDIPLPSHEEQRKIGEYFKTLDHLITLHQHKCEELQNIKKFMLQNMFI